jgi:murein DD-endopeptidase
MRLGLFDLALALLVVWTAWTHTPAGGVASMGLKWATGGEVELASVTRFFESTSSSNLVQHVATTGGPPIPVTDHFPQPWRTAAWRVMSSGGPNGTTPDAALNQLDDLWDADPEAALSEFVLGPELRSRAISRARASGAENPESYKSFRPFLPANAMALGDRYIADTLAVATMLDIEWPIRIKHRITSPYGMRVHPVQHIEKMHNGVDLGVPIGTPVHAPQAGVLDVVAHDPKRSGKYIVIDHGNGVRTAYCHLDEMPFPKGTQVEKGQVFAKSGNTGPSTGPHVHFVVRVKGKTVDPALLGHPSKIDAPAENTISDPAQDATTPGTH